MACSFSGHSGRIPTCCQAIRARLLRDSSCGGWRWRHLRSPRRSGRWAELRHAGRRSRSVSSHGSCTHHSDSGVIVFIEIAAGLESQLEIITDVPAGATWFAPDGRLPHFPSSVWAAAGDERCGGVEETFPQSTAGSADEGQARLSFQFAKARSPKRTAKRSASNSDVARLPKRQSQANLQATMLTYMEGFAGRLAALEVNGAAPIPTPYSSVPAMLGTHAAPRKWGSPALDNNSTQRKTQHSTTRDTAKQRTSSLRLLFTLTVARIPLCLLSG